MRPEAPSWPRRRLLAALAAGLPAATLAPGLWARDVTPGPRVSPELVRRWDSGNTVLAPLTAHASGVLFAGNSHLGRIVAGQAEPVWRQPLGWSDEAVFRPRTAGDRVLCRGLGELGAWGLAAGERQWRHTARLQLGVPWVAPQRTFVGDGHELLALDTASGAPLWRFSTTPDTLAAYAPVLSGETVMFGPGNGLLYALDAASGRVKWRLDRQHEWQYLRQLHVTGGVLVAGSYKELLYGISVADGRVLWTFSAGNFINSHHVAGNTAYLWSPTGWVYAIDTGSGQVKWRHRTTNYGSAGANWGPLMAELTTHGAHLYALDMQDVLHVLDRQTGEEVQRVALGRHVRPTVVPQADRQAFLASDQGEVLLLRW